MHGEVITMVLKCIIKKKKWLLWYSSKFYGYRYPTYSKNVMCTYFGMSFWHFYFYLFVNTSFCFYLFENTSLLSFLKNQLKILCSYFCFRILTFWTLDLHTQKHKLNFWSRGERNVIGTTTTWWFIKNKKQTSINKSQ